MKNQKSDVVSHLLIENSSFEIDDSEVFKLCGPFNETVEMQRQDCLRNAVSCLIEKTSDWANTIAVSNIEQLTPMIHEDFAFHQDSSHEISDDAITSKLLLIILGYKELERVHP